MSDVGIYIVDNCFDLLLDGKDLAGDDGLETAVTISLFSDQRITDDEKDENFKTSKRGWWGDGLSPIDKDEIGSKMWLIERGKRTQSDLRRLERYAEKSLEWMLEDGVAINIEVVGSFEANQTVLNISITKPNNKETRYDVLWDGQEVRRP